MPFKSLAQLDYCYNTNRWDCDRWLQHTDSIACLPYRSRVHTDRKCIYPNEKMLQYHKDDNRIVDITELSDKDSFTHTVYRYKKTSLKDTQCDYMKIKGGRCLNSVSAKDVKGVRCHVHLQPRFL